ncbi:unnamed protein product [marine sediment metagenome]|uniref:Uncharacterized protein n=1 Tax=marine sediment metagenome TaxID=412755 RepID=X1LBM9_9ZZZZ
MAKLKGPLFSLGASQQLGKALVYFSWKGLNVVREYVIPSNPKSKGQRDQRGYLTAVVAAIHRLQASPYPLNEVDTRAYALWGSTYPTPRTWFNQAVKNWLDQKVVPKTAGLCYNGVVTPGPTELAVAVNVDPASADTAGDFYYGTSKTALINKKGATPTATKRSATITGLAKGTKFFIQYRSNAPNDSIGIRSGIYYGTPT